MASSFGFVVSLKRPMSFFIMSFYCDIDMPLIVSSAMDGVIGGPVCTYDVWLVCGVWRLGCTGVWVAGVGVVLKAGCVVVEQDG